MPLQTKRFLDYRSVIEPELYDEIIGLAGKLKGARILHLNATAHGGGVAIILRSLLPLVRDLGIKVNWRIIDPTNEEFFVATKTLHNSLQGAKTTLTNRQWALYEMQNRLFAAKIQPINWDYIMIHDPQPAAMRQYTAEGTAKWVWRCHIDLSQPNPQTKKRFIRYLDGYDGAIFTLKDYVLSSMPPTKTTIMPVAIDPLDDKNRSISPAEARMTVAGYGIDLNKPLIVQISRFDPWKDQPGVVAAWRLAKRKIPDLQLVLMGDAASDDPEGSSVLEQVMSEVKNDQGVNIITDTNDLAVNAFQTVANVVLQKSIREGFGLTVAEALWAKTPVIGGAVGGIPTQIKDGKNGYLVTTPAQAAARIVELIKNPLKAQRMGQWGHDYVRRHFLLPRLLRDELKFLLKL